jgi:hypothetical protein
MRSASQAYAPSQTFEVAPENRSEGPRVGSRMCNVFRNGRPKMRQTILAGISALALIAAAAPAVAGEDYPLFAAPALGGRAAQPSQKLSGAAQARLGNNPNNQGRNFRVAPGRAMGAPAMGGIRGRR